MACSSEETTRTAETAGSTLRPVAFKEAYTVQPTRSSAMFTATAGIPVGQSMGVYAYLHNTETRNYLEDSPNFMWNQKATRQEETEPFTYAPLKYWPNDENSKLSFIAYFPYCNGADDDGTDEDIASTGITPRLTNSGTGLPTFDFTVKNAIDDQVDFLVSDVLPNMPKSRDTDDDPGLPFNDLTITDRVQFLFKHMTAKVEFRIVADAAIRKDIVKFRLSSLGITNIYKTGTLSTSYSAGTTNLSWSDQSNVQDYTFKTYEPQLLMPQTLLNTAMLNLSYNITFKSDGTSYRYEGSTPVAEQDYTYYNEASLQLNTMKLTDTDIPLTTWEPNHHYIYTIRLRANRIDFKGEVVDWGEYKTLDDIPIEGE